MLKIVEARIQSDSFSQRIAKVTTLVLHHTALNFERSIYAMVHGATSAHYVVAEDGVVYKILEDNEVAYHAGLSKWRGVPQLNGRSIGIEIVNLDGNVNAYPQKQVDAARELSALIMARNPDISGRNVVGHADIAPSRKKDPGLMFPWQELSEKGIGIWPKSPTPRLGATPAEVQALLKKLGYTEPYHYAKINGIDKFVDPNDPQFQLPGAPRVNEVPLKAIIRDFQRHFRPSKVNGVIDAETVGILDDLVKQLSRKPKGKLVTSKHANRKSKE
jgi:N-acetylmuramoyl-L-alanine amidase